MDVKICHISTVHSYDDDRILFKECVSLAQEGYEVYFVVPYKDYDTVHGVKIVPISQKEGRFNRIFVKSWSALKNALKVRAEIYHFHDPELIFVGAILKILGKKVVYDAHEDVPFQILNKSWLGNIKIRKVISSVYNFVEKGISKHFDGVVTVTEGIQKKFSCKRTILLRNLPVKRFIDEAEEFKGIKKEVPVLIYAGGLTRIRGIKELVEVTGKFSGKVNLWLLGKWESDEFQKECMEAAGGEFTKYIGYKPMNEVYSYMKASDIGCCTLYPTKNHMGSLPVKAYEYMACSLPIVMSNFPYWLENYRDFAVFADPNNIDDIYNKIDELLKDDTLRTSLKNNGEDFIKNKYSWEVECKNLFNLYDEILKE